MSSPAEIRAQIQSAVEQVKEAMGAVGSAHSTTDTAIATGTAATQDTASTLPGEALAQWRQAKDHLDEALTLYQSGTDALDQYGSTI